MGKHPKGKLGSSASVVNLNKKKRKKKPVGPSMKPVQISSNLSKICDSCENEIPPDTLAWFSPAMKKWRHKGCRKGEGW